MIDRILLARFDIDMAALGGFEFATLDFRPYQDVLDKYLGQIKLLRNNVKFKHYEYPPVRRLNAVLTGSAPILVHGFEKCSYATWYGKHSNIKFSDRCLLVLTTDSAGNSLWKPEVDQFNDLVAVWATEWIKEQFSEVVSSRSARGMLDELNREIRTAKPEWKVTRAADLWSLKGSLKYDALPSVLAAIFVERMNEEVFRLNEEMPLRWRLTEEGAKRLAIVSEPLPYVGKRQGLFSYKIEFVLQTQAGRERPWIAVYLRIRRWADRAIKKVNFGRKVSVMMTLQSERKPGWQFTPTMIKLQIARNGNGFYWAQNEPELLKAWQARDLVDPTKLFTNPKKFQSHALGSDTYHILHTEGISYTGSKTHAMNAGTSLRERANLMNHISDVMQGILTADTFMATDKISTITPAQIIENQLLPMYTFDDLSKSGAVLPARSSRKDVRQLCHEMTMNALLGGSGDKEINIMLIAPEAPARRIIEREVRRLLFMEDGEDWPQGVHITHIESDLQHLMPPATSEIPLYPGKKEIEEQKYQQVLDQAWQQKVNDWERLLTPHVRSDMCNLALIEITEHDRDEWLKRAIRRACIQSGVLSQMLYTIDPKIENTSHFAPDERARITNAVKDLLLRQMNVLYGSLSDVYQYAGLSEKDAQELVVVGLYRHKTNFPYYVDLPIAVELHPDGRVLVVFPDATGKPQDPVLYTEAGPKIGRLFAEGDNKHYKLNNEQITTFAEAILTQPRDNDVLFLFEADSWRSGILPLTNNDLAQVITNQTEQSYQIVLNNQMYTPQDLNGVRMLRLRGEGTLGETPHYIAAPSGTTWEDWSEFGDPEMMIGAIDQNAGTPLFHFFSIGRQLQAVSKQNEDKNEMYSYDEGGNVAYKHQQAVEIVPFFLQPGDNPLAYSRIAHFLRSSPAWKGGNTVLPYPLHLAQTLIKDLMDVFSPKL